MSQSYKVIATFLNRATGKLVKPGDEFEPHSTTQLEKLMQMGCVVAGAQASAKQEPKKVEEPEVEEEKESEQKPEKRRGFGRKKKK